MEIRKTKPEDADRVMEIYAAARRFMREHDNPTQWADGRPFRQDIETDINEGCSYICLHEAKTVGVLRFTVGDDPTYKKIDGRWMSDEPYAVVHRIASSGEVKGTGEFMLRWAMGQHPHIRIDTHEDNYVMRGLLDKLGFTYCGVIYLKDGAPRLAYEKCK
ncbi:MAG: GNAT family N-acetyltransferase [Clostridia bacterium]|nr:GNAT family N-acetyltransferase [Clostridia bacterium]